MAAKPRVVDATGGVARAVASRVKQVSALCILGVGFVLS